MAHRSPWKPSSQEQYAKHSSSSRKHSVITSPVVSFRYKHDPWIAHVAAHIFGVRLHVKLTHCLPASHQESSRQCSTPASLNVVLWQKLLACPTSPMNSPSKHAPHDVPCLVPCRLCPDRSSHQRRRQPLPSRSPHMLPRVVCRAHAALQVHQAGAAFPPGPDEADGPSVEHHHALERLPHRLATGRLWLHLSGY